MIFILFRKPKDLSTTENRSFDRNRRIALAAASGVISKVISFVISLISVPVTVNYLGYERYGFWMTVSSTISFLGFADMGLGNGLLTALSEAKGKNDVDNQEKYISSTFYFLFLISILLSLVFLLTIPLVSWRDFFNLRTTLGVEEFNHTIIIIFLCFVLNFPLSIIQKIQLAFQEGYINFLWLVIGNILGLIGMITIVYLKGSLPLLVLPVSLAPLISNIINSYLFLRKNNFKYLPKVKHVNWLIVKQMGKLGMQFFLLQTLALLISSSDNLIISRILGVSSVTPYAIVFRLFTAAQIANYIILPLWPAFGEAVARGDFQWAKRTLFRFVMVTCCFSALISLPLVIFGNSIIKWWAHTDITVSTPLLLGFGLWSIFSAYIGTMSTFLNQRQLLSKQVVFFTLTALVSIIFKILFAFKFNIDGVIWGNLLAYGTFFLFPSIRLAHKFLEKEGF